MLHFNENIQYFLYNGITDMRKSFDALSGMVRQFMNANIVDGGVFIFINRKRDQIKLLHWDIDGLAIYYKRLEKGTFEMPTAKPDTTAVSIDAFQLQLILKGIVLSSVRKKKRFSLTV